MEQIPKIVRDRLKVLTAAVNHPNADVLTAFSERSLPELERAVVLEHLARCGECREVLALSLPATEDIQTAPQPGSASWFARPALRWGFVAAGILLVGSAGVLQYWKESRSSMVAYRAPVPAISQEESTKKAVSRVPAAEPASPADTASVTAPDTLKSENAKSLANASPRRDEAPATAARSDVPVNRTALPHGPRMANQQLYANVQQQNANLLQAAQAPAAPMPSPKQQSPADLNTQARFPSASQTVEVAGVAPTINSQGENVQALVVQSQPLDQQPMNGGQSESKADATRTAVIGFNAAAKVPGRSGGIGSGMGYALNASNARWSITSSGALQRSMDQGNSWQDVNVADKSAAAPASLMLTANSPAKDLDVKDAKKEKIERSKAASIVFRAVSANGPDVWAGGSAGALYHSTDAGAHWIRVVPSTTASTLTGEILTVSFPDPQHGRISTSTSEVWTTANAGMTWQKQ